MMRALILAVLLLALSTPAMASTLVIPPPDAHYPYQGWISGSAVPTPNETLTVVESTEGNCPAVNNGGCTDATLHGNVYIQPRPGFTSRRRVRLLLMHEIGHRYDYFVATDTQRNRFQQLAGGLRPWRAEPNSPHELFAEAYALCSVHGRLPRGVSFYVGWRQITPRRFARICVLFGVRSRPR